MIPDSPWKDLPLTANRLRPYQVELMRMEAEEAALERRGKVFGAGGESSVL